MPDRNDLIDRHAKTGADVLVIPSRQDAARV